MQQLSELSAEIKASRDAVKKEDFDSALIFSPLTLRSNVGAARRDSAALDMTEFAIARRMSNSQDIAVLFNVILERAQTGSLSAERKGKLAEAVQQFARRRRAQETLAVPKPR